MLDETSFSRRAVAKASAIAVGSGVVGGGTLLYGSQPAVALPDNQLDASGVETVTNDGQISELNLEDDIEVEIHWEGFEDDPDADVTLEARNGDQDTEFGVVFEDTDIPLNGLEGERTLDDEDLGADFELNIFEAVEDPELTGLEEEEFEAEESGTEEWTTVEFRLSIELDDGGNTASDTQQDDFDVEVTNLDSDSDGGGSTSVSTDGDDQE